MTEKKKVGRPLGHTKYSEETIDKCLMALAYTGQARAAYRELKLGGMTPLPGESTIREWRHKYSGRIASIIEIHGAEIERHRVAGYLDIIANSQEAVQLSIDKATEAVEAAGKKDDEGEPLPMGDARMITALSGAARNFATIYGITQDKMHIIQGKPTSIVGKEKEAEEGLRSLADRFGVDSKPKELEEKSNE